MIALTGITLTGGSGFIGSTLATRLARRQAGFGILDTRPSPLFPERAIQCDICDTDQLRAHLQGDTVIHLAAEHRDDVRPRQRYHDVNVGGTKALVAVAREKGIDRIVFTSTVAVYGFAPPDTAEDGAIAPFNDYGRTKFQAEQVLRAWQAEAPDRRSLTILRPTVVFGPGNRGNVYNLLSFAGSGRFVMIGAGRNRKSMAYVENIAAFLHHATGFGPGVHLFNYVDKPDLDMNALVSLVRGRLLGRPGTGPRVPYWFGLAGGYVADAVSAVSGRRLPISSIRVRKFCADSSFASAAHGVPGFTPVMTLSEGLEHTLQREFLTPDPDAPVFETE